MEAEFPVTPRTGVECQLGEGLHWDGDRQCLWFVDILARRLHAWRPDEPQARSWTCPQFIGWAIPCSGRNSLLLGLREGVVLVDPAQDDLRPRWVTRPFFELPRLRLNDAKADSSGAIWFGSLNHEDESRSDGSLLRLSADGVLSTHDSGYRVANGPAISADGSLMLHTDSGRRTIYAFDLDVAAGTLRNKRVWLTLTDDQGYPDGMCFDADGCVWVAHWGAGCITRHDLAGRQLARIDLPAPLISNVCFGGAGMDRLFVTSARVGMGAAALSRHTLSGRLFEVDGHGARGLSARCGAQRLGGLVPE